MDRLTRRAALAGFGSLAFGGLVSAHDRKGQLDYAEVDFPDQVTGGRAVRVGRMAVDADAFITIHSWGLISEQDGPNTILGVDGPFSPGEYESFEVPLFDHGIGASDAFDGVSQLGFGVHQLVAVPHLDKDHDGAFNFDHENPTDVPFGNGPQTVENTPFPGAVNDTGWVVSLPLGGGDA